MNAHVQGVLGAVLLQLGSHGILAREADKARQDNECACAGRVGRSPTPIGKPWHFGS